MGFAKRPIVFAPYKGWMKERLVSASTFVLLIEGPSQDEDAHDYDDEGSEVDSPAEELPGPQEYDHEPEEYPDDGAASGKPEAFILHVPAPLFGPLPELLRTDLDLLLPTPTLPTGYLEGGSAARAVSSIFIILSPAFSAINHAPNLH